MSREVFEYYFSAEELGGQPAETGRSLAIEQQTTTGTPTQDASESVAPAGPSSPPLDVPASDAAQDAPSPRQAQPPSELAKALASDTTPDLRPASMDATREEATDPPRAAHYAVRRLLSVHALGQYVYCARSALLAAERGDESDADEPPPRLTYLPNFDLERIEEALSAALGQLALCAGCAAGLAAVMVYAVHAQAEPLFWPAAALLLFSLWWATSLLDGVMRLALRRRAALTAEARQPDPEVRSVEPVNWWSLLKCGFEPVTYQRPFRHPDLPLEGRPWRVLERDSLRIPVVRSGGARLGPEGGGVYRKHSVRLAAYALLLESTGHAATPYGVVLPDNSPRGFAVAVTDALRAEAQRLLAEFAEAVERSERLQVDPRAPEQRGRCERCGYGKPEPVTVREVESLRTSGDRLQVLRRPNGQTFHCVCGDRFDWTPPHGDAVKLDLAPSLK